jgi:glycosyltransferase involved in cell wall biosynthesis
MPPRISIVTPSFNQRLFLEQTMRSVLGQQGSFDIQWIVVDGGSTDGTIDLLKSINDPRVQWTSEPDNGQADAVNRGLRRADGDLIGWINSDDLYVPDALAAVASAFEDRAVQWVVGRCENVGPEGQVIRSAIAQYKDHYLTRYSYRKLLRENFICQPAVFWRREFGQKVDGLDESLHYTMDYDLWLRMGKMSPPKIIDRMLAQFRIHPSSKSGKVNREQFDEGYRVACRYFDGDVMSRIAHRFNVEKIVWAYRVMWLLGR